MTEEQKIKKRLADKAYREKNREKMKQYSKEYYKNNKEKWVYSDEKKQQIKERRKNQPSLQPEYVRQYAAEYRNKNQHKRTAWENDRRALQLNAKPDWANDFIIEEMYELAKRRTEMHGFKWHVDHIIPLKNKIVCGLHCEYNLRVIPATENLKKYNKFYA